MAPHGPSPSILSLAKATLTGLAQQNTSPSYPPQIPPHAEEMTLQMTLDLGFHVVET